MAERVEEQEGTVDTTVDQPSPAAMALALGRSRRANKNLDTEAEGFLRDQRELINLQKEHLHEQRAVILARLRLGRFSDWMKALLQVMTALVGLAVVIALMVMAWQAHEDHGLVVQPFSVPPDLAQRGLTGEVIASRLIDRLAELQTDTISGRPASSYANNWGDDIKVEIPETGVSIGELNRWLRKLLGHETTISGEVYRTPTGIALAAHAESSPSTVHTGADADLDDLIRQAAEDVYSATQPYRYAMYLGERKPDLGIAALEKLAHSGGTTDRKWAYDGLGGILMETGDFADGLRAESASIAVDPKFWPAWSMRASALTTMGRDQEALAVTEHTGELMRRYDAGGAAGRRQLIRQLILTVDADLAAARGDFSRAARETTGATAPSGAPSSPALYDLASDQLHLHDLTAAHDVEAQITPSPRAAMFEIQRDMAAKAMLDAAAAEEIENWPTLWSVYSGIDRSQLSGRARESLATYVTPLAAMARAKLGDIVGAQTLVASTPLDCYLCVRTHGQIAAVAHDWAGADRWFAEAVRQAPSLPFAYAEWGQSLLDKADFDRAITELKQAHKFGPHYADPLETWGEALMAEHEYAGAISKFAEADKDAPKWGRNHLRWGEALMLSGHYAEARAQYQIANGLDLSVGDRAALNVLLARTASGPLHG